MKTYSEFIEVVNSKIALYAQIPERHLSIEGMKVYDLYKAVEFLACFTTCASELLDMMKEDEDVQTAAKFAENEYRKILRCIDSLAAAEITEVA